MAKSMEKEIKLEIVDGDGNIVNTYIVKRLNIRANARRLALIGKVIDLDVNDTEKGQLLSCASLAATVYNEKGELSYPTDNAHEVVYDEMDIEEYDALCAAYLEVNPLQPSLTAKKKKS